MRATPGTAPCTRSAGGPPRASPPPRPPLSRPPPGAPPRAGPPPPPPRPPPFELVGAERPEQLARVRVVRVVRRRGFPLPRDASELLHELVLRHPITQWFTLRSCPNPTSRAPILPQSPARVSQCAIAP